MTAIRSERELLRDFAVYYAHTGSIRQSAIYAGVPPENEDTVGMRLAVKPYTKRVVKKVRKENSSALLLARQGLERLAFGSINDSVVLCFTDEVNLADVIKSDLFNVSEIKKVKGGGVEIKFFDRQKALEKLIELDTALTGQSSAESFLSALKGTPTVKTSEAENEVQ